MIKVVGKTNPFIINLARSDKPFHMDEFYKIENGKVLICRIIKSESISRAALSSLPRDVYEDVKEVFKDSERIYLATAKMETKLIAPVISGSEVTYPSFDNVKKLLVGPPDSIVLGEINGTDIFMETVPQEYKDLFLIRKNGKVVNQDSLPFLFDYTSLYESPHIGLFGGSGSGKTFALKVITEEVMNKRIPMILLDPHLEMNFSVKRKDIPQESTDKFKDISETFTIGLNVGINFCDIKTEELISIMEFSGEMSSAMGTCMREIHKQGETFINLKNKIERLIFLIGEKELGRLKEDKLSPSDLLIWTTYGCKIPHIGTLPAVAWRLSALESTGIFNGDIHQIKAALMNRKVCVLRGEMRSINIVCSYITSVFYYLRKNYIDGREQKANLPSFVPFIVAMDEAHIFCPKGSEITPLKKILRTISQEGRKYGVFEIMATQRPSLLDETIVSQMSTKFIFKLSIKEDILSVEKETDLEKEEIARLPYMETGEAFVSSSIIGKTASIRIKYNMTELKTKDNPFNELDDFKLPDDKENFILELLPINELALDVAMDKVNEKFGTNNNITEIVSILEKMVDEDMIKKEISALGAMYYK